MNNTLINEINFNENEFENFFNLLECIKSMDEANSVEFKNKLSKWKELCNLGIDYNYRFEFFNSSSLFSIIDGGWGEGKTYWIEKVIYYWLLIKKILSKKSNKKEWNFLFNSISQEPLFESQQEKIKEKIKNKKDVINFYKNIVYIDIQSFSLDSRNELLDYLFSNIEPIITKTKWFQKIKDWFKSLKVDFSIKSLYYSMEYSISLSKSNETNDDNNQIFTSLKKIIEIFDEEDLKKDKTLIFIDNIERIDRDINDIIRLINSLCLFPSLTIICPTNLSLIEDEKDIKYLEKYINSKIIKIKNNKREFLKKMFDDDKLCDCFVDEMNNSPLSHREITKIFSYSNLKYEFKKDPLNFKAIMEEKFNIKNFSKYVSLIAKEYSKDFESNLLKIVNSYKELKKEILNYEEIKNNDENVYEFSQKFSLFEFIYFLFKSKNSPYELNLLRRIRRIFFKYSRNTDNLVNSIFEITNRKLKDVYEKLDLRKKGLEQFISNIPKAILNISLINDFNSIDFKLFSFSLLIESINKIFKNDDFEDID